MTLFKHIPITTVTDIELITQYQQTANQQPLAQLFLRYSDLVYGCCIKYLENQESAKDAVMAIYQELTEKLAKHQVLNFKSWLYVLTKNHCLMLLRKQKTEPKTILTNEFMQSGDFSHLDDVLQKEQQLTMLEQCIQQLSDDQRKSVELFYLQNKCYNEITELTGFDWNKVRSLVQNARRNLKICMEANG